MGDDLATLLIFLAGVVFSLIKRFAGDPHPPDVHADLAEVLQREASHSPGGRSVPDWANSDELCANHAVTEPDGEAARLTFLERLETLRDRAQRELENGRVQWVTNRVAQVVEDFILPHASGLLSKLSRPGSHPEEPDYELVENLELALGAVELFAQQRRVPGLREALGDADKIAMGCYEPMLDFARMHRIEVTSSTPVTTLSDHDLSIWTGFLPTGVAPLFLPRDFFASLHLWPALAHEMGHDFLAAAHGVSDGLRQQLGLPPEHIGIRPLHVQAGELQTLELRRVVGGWFEELFCDVFGTLMMGPAYGYTMVELFQSPDDPRQVVEVELDDSDYNYDVHPPRHLRVLVCARVLSLIGEQKASRNILQEWCILHGSPEAFLFPTDSVDIWVTASRLEHIVTDVVERLCDSPMTALAGHSLSSIPGCDWGPHAAQEARRAEALLRCSTAPIRQSARSVVAGAVMALREQPDRESEFLLLARRAIVGVSEHREDVYHQGARPHDADRNGPVDPGEALILHTLLGRPVALLNVGGGTSFLRRLP